MLSLFACLALTALWARSYRTAQFLGWSDRYSFVGVLSMQGLLRFEYATYPADKLGWSYVTDPTPRGASPGLWGEIAARDRDGRLRGLGIAWSRVDYNFDGQRVRRSLYLPHWLFAAAAAVAPANRLRRALRSRRRRAPGLCAVCGYNLTGNVSGVCPECGSSLPA